MLTRQISRKLTKNHGGILTNAEFIVWAGCICVCRDIRRGGGRLRGCDGDQSKIKSRPGPRCRQRRATTVSGPVLDRPSDAADRPIGQGFCDRIYFGHDQGAESPGPCRFLASTGSNSSRPSPAGSDTGQMNVDTAVTTTTSRLRR